MPKPIIVVLPETEREALRTAGVLPPGTFRTFGEDGGDAETEGASPSVYLWPYAIDYSAGARLVERMDERPPDIPAFFGVPPGEDDAVRMENERLVARLLDGIVVHIVFLDRESSRPGYARFGSFSELTSWSRAFKRALRARYTNEAEFQETENVLIVVARGEQAKPTEKELDDFKANFGHGQAFQSCYFLDHMLQASDTRRLFHSALVWDVVVSRLLLAFLLDRERMDAEGCHIEPFWRRPGIRIWRSLECRPILSPAIRQKASDCLGAACERLQGQLGGDVLSVSVPQAPSVDFGSIPTLVPAEGLQPTWRTIPSDGWSDFDKDGILSPKTEDETRWVEAFKTVGDSFSEWSKSNRPDSGARDVRNRFQGVHADPRRLFAERRAVFEFLERDKIETERIAGETDPLAKTWEIVTRLTKERKDIQMRLRQECKDFALARNHYVGWGMGLFVVAAVSCLFSWVLIRIVAALGASPLYSLLLGGATFLGAFLACAGVLWLHGRSGKLGALACGKTSLASDKVAIERDGVVRKLVQQALAFGRQSRLRGQFFRAWALLTRTEKILLTELQPSAATVAFEEEEENGGDAEGKPDYRNLFIRLTCRGIGEGDGDLNEPFNPELSDEPGHGGIEDVVHAWWEASDDDAIPQDVRPRESFLELWSRLCKFDSEVAGYFPAKAFSREIAAFVADFAEAIRRLASRRVRDGNVETFQHKLSNWLSSQVCAVRINQFASAAFTASQTNDAQRRTGHVWFVDDARVADIAGLQDEANLRGHSFQTILHASPLLSRLPQLGFFFQEFDVGFGIDETEGTGRLIITEASHD